MPIENKNHKQSRSHPFRRYIATTKDFNNDEFHVLTLGEVNGGKVENANCSFGGGGK